MGAHTKGGEYGLLTIRTKPFPAGADDGVRLAQRRRRAGPVDRTTPSGSPTHMVPCGMAIRQNPSTRWEAIYRWPPSGPAECSAPKHQSGGAAASHSPASPTFTVSELDSEVLGQPSSPVRLSGSRARHPWRWGAGACALACG